MEHEISSEAAGRKVPESRLRNRGADLAAEVLRAHGITQIMALTGGAIMEGMDALDACDGLTLRFFQTESGAAWAAMGYARATGKVGVCVVTSGPAATNTITPISDAQRDNVPLLVITGQVPSYARNSDAFQETNITGIAEPTAKKVFYLSQPDQIVPVFSEALSLASRGRPGPVLIDFTKDAQQAEVDLGGAVLPKRMAAEELGHPIPDSQIDAVVDCLARAERPVTIVGYGAVLAGVQRDLEEFLDLYPCPLVHTLPGKGAFPSRDPRNYGMLGMHGFYVANWIVHNADLLISFGSRFDDRITGAVEHFAPEARRLIHFDIDGAQISKVLAHRKLGVVGDLRLTLPALNERLKQRSFDSQIWKEEIAKTTRDHPSTYSKDPNLLQVPTVLQAVNEIARRVSEGRSVTFATEVGDHQMWCGQYLALEKGWRFITSSGQGAMGAGLPMAIGSQLAHLKDLIICIAGDGSLRLSEAELETVCEYQLPIKILLMNNHGYGIVRMWNHLFYGKRETGVVKRGKDWEALARANGFRPEHIDRVEDPADLKPVLENALRHSEPHFVELVTPYEECLPLWPPGKTFHDIILPEFG